MLTPKTYVAVYKNSVRLQNFITYTHSEMDRITKHALVKSLNNKRMEKPT